MKTEIRFDRLGVLADALEDFEQKGRVFDLTVFHKENAPTGLNACTTVGCAIGECPYIWPDAWVFDHVTKLPVLRAKELGTLWRFDSNSVIAHAREWFGLSEDEVNHLFMPAYMVDDIEEGSVLPADASADEVLANIRKFILSGGKRWEHTPETVQEFMEAHGDYSTQRPSTILRRGL